MKFLLLMLVLTFTGIYAAEAQIVVIANKSVSDAQVTGATMKQIYSLEKTKWANGTRIVPVTLNVPAAEAAVQTYMGAQFSDLKKVWLRLKLSGEGQPPEALKSAEEVVNKVASTPGAIGFIPQAAANANVKVVATLK